MTRMSAFESNNNKELNQNNIKNKKKFIITSALPYANGEIHLGHISSTYLPADIFTRYLRLCGHEVFHICASDDYGTPILIKAEKENMTPTEFVNYWNKRDIDDFKLLDIDFDLFSKTSSIENQELVKDVFLKLNKNGHIYEKEIIQHYCEYDKKFLPDRYVVGTCPFCNAENQYSDLCEKCGRVPQEILFPKCGICGKPPVLKKSKHYFFKLTNFSSQLQKWLVENKNLQDDIKNYVIRWIDEGLQDWDITRDLTWGITIPFEDIEDKVFYGWFDNHLCYISSIISLCSKKNIDGKKFWNDSTIYHFIGKDIVYHHFLFLPAIRMGIGLEYKLPDYIPCRGHLMLENKKISKSRNWYIGLKDFLGFFNQDYLRFYIASISSYSQDDINFDWNLFYEKINNELISNIGNFINRTLSFTNKNFDGINPSFSESEFTDDDREILALNKKVANEVGTLLSNNEIDQALKGILKFSTSCNQYFQKKQPWADKTTSSITIYIAVNLVYSITILLYPFLPSSSKKIWKQLGLEEEEEVEENKIENQNWNNIGKLSINVGHKISISEPIFKRIEIKEIEQQKIRLINPIT